MIETAGPDDVDPQAGGPRVLERIREYKTDRVGELLPGNTGPAAGSESDSWSRVGGDAGRLRGTDYS